MMHSYWSHGLNTRPKQSLRSLIIFRIRIRRGSNIKSEFFMKAKVVLLAAACFTKNYIFQSSDWRLGKLKESTLIFLRFQICTWKYVVRGPKTCVVVRKEKCHYIIYSFFPHAFSIFILQNIQTSAST